MLDQMQPKPPALPLARSLGSGGQIAGTRSRKDSSASTRESILSVLHANGANPLTRCASAISTSHPCATSSSCTNARRSWTPPPRAPARRTPHPTRQPVKAIAVRRRGEVIDQLSLVGDKANIHAPATEIQANVQHMKRASSRLVPR